MARAGGALNPNAQAMLEVERSAPDEIAKNVPGGQERVTNGEDHPIREETP